MAYIKGVRLSLLQVVMLMLSCNMVHHFSKANSIGRTELLKYLGIPTLKTDSPPKYPVLRRRIKSPLREDDHGSADGYIGRDEPAKGQRLERSRQLELDEAYPIFLQHQLGVKDDKGISPDYVIEKPASTFYSVKIASRNGYAIEVKENGAVQGTLNHMSPNTRLKLLMYERQVVGIRTESRPYRYLIMTQDGKMTTNTKPTIQSVFYYRTGSKNRKHHYFTFQRAYQRRKWFVAFKSKGRGPHAGMKRGKNTNRDRKSAHFIVLNLNRKTRF